MIKNIFKQKAENKKSNAIPLTDEGQMDSIKIQSYQSPILIFKHSSRCGLSSMILNRFEKRIKDSELDFYLLDVLKNRKTSIFVSKHFNIQHESPQLLYVKEGAVVSHGSHASVLDVNIDD